MPVALRRALPLWGDRRAGPRDAHFLVPDRSHGLCPTRAWLPRTEGTAAASTSLPPNLELVRGYFPATIGSGGNHAAGVSPRFGKGIEWVAANGFGLDVGDETDLLPTAAAITVVLGKTRTSASLSAAGAFGVLDNGANFAVRCGADIPFSDGVVYWDYGGVTAGTSRLSIGGLTFGDDVWAFTVGGRGMEIWQNAVKVASNGGGVSRSDSGGDFYIGSGNNTAAADRTDNCVIPFLYVYNRELPESAIVSICLDPYQWLLPLKVRRPYKAAALNTLIVTLDAIALQAQSLPVRSNFGTVYCRQHRIFYVLDDRFPAPCAKWGGHESAQPGA